MDGLQFTKPCWGSLLFLSRNIMLQQTELKQLGQISWVSSDPVRSIFLKIHRNTAQEFGFCSHDPWLTPASIFCLCMRSDSLLLTHALLLPCAFPFYASLFLCCFHHLSVHCISVPFLFLWCLLFCLMSVVISIMIYLMVFVKSFLFQGFWYACKHFHLHEQ